MKDEAEIIRDLIKNENEMVNHRMNWFLILQGFMFAAISFAWEKDTLLCVVFSLVGAFSALSVGSLLRCGIIAIRNLESQGEKTLHKVIGRTSRETPKIIHILLPWQFLPVLMVIAWLLILLIRIINPI